MSVRRVWLIGVGVAVIAVAGLAVAGSRGVWVREFALRAPDQESVALLQPSRQVCEGPVTSPTQIQGVGIWGGSAIGFSALTVEVRDASTQETLASGTIHATAPAEYVARLPSPVSAGRPLRVCVVGNLNSFSLLGSAALQPDVVMSGKNHGLEFSLVLLSYKRSLLSALPTAFSRASLWRPSWVGSWTFWLLAAALLATFGLGVAAVVSAAADDEEDRPGRDQNGEDDPAPSIRRQPGSTSDPAPASSEAPTPARGGRG